MGKQIYVTAEAHKLLELLCAFDQRRPVDEVMVVMREAVERRKIKTPTGGKGAKS